MATYSAPLTVAFALAATVLSAASSPASAAPVPFGASLYDLILDDQISWPDARAAAGSSGGHLATITSAGEQAFIESLLADRAAPTGAYWFGLEEIDNSNVFVPINNETSSFENFTGGEPNSGITVAESVGSIFWSVDSDEPGFDRRGRWNDLPPGGYPDPAFVTDEADLFRAGYLIEFKGVGSGNDNGGNDNGGNGNGGNGGGNGSGGDGGGPNPIPIPPAALAFPAAALIALAAGRRMLRG